MTLLSGLVTSLCLNLVWASVLHIQAYRHRLEVEMIDELVRHSLERAPLEPSPCALCQTQQHPRQCDASVIKPFFPPWTRGSEPMVGGTFSSDIIPSSASIPPQA